MRKYLPVQPPGLEPGSQNANYRYREYMPGRELEPYVACYWTLEYQASDILQPHRIVPDGCVDIIIDLRPPTLSSGAFVAGLMTRYEAVSLSASCTLFGIRMYSDCARQIIAYPVSAFSDSSVLLEEVWGNEASLFTESVLAADTVSGRIERVEAKLAARIRSNKCITDHLLRQSMQYMYASKGTLSIPALAGKLSYSERTIRRVFQQELGMSPKELSGIIRFQSLLREFNGGTRFRLTDLALKYGYYDQSHFIRHFKRYYGLAPKQVLE